MNKADHLLHSIAITMNPRLNNRLFLPLFEQCGGFEGFFREKESLLTRLWGELSLENIRLKRELWLEQAEKELEFMQKEGVYCCTWESHLYPRLLQYCPDAPLILYYKGNISDPQTKNLAVVGTRKASERCKSRVESIIKRIAEMNYQPVIISGLAYGIDITAHQAALRHQLKTVAVLGHGLNLIYPAAHKSIAEKILAQEGCLISEFPSQTKILPINFLQRNRIVAGMSEATLIAESAARGGAMATARQAFSYDRTVMAIPGRPEDRLSSGCNQLIKENIASLTEEAEDVLQLLGWEVRTSQPIQLSLDFFGQPDKEEQIKTILKEQGEQHIDLLSQASGIPIQELTPLLLKLELEGVVVPLPGKIFSLT